MIDDDVGNALRSFVTLTSVLFSDFNWNSMKIQRRVMFGDRAIRKREEWTSIEIRSCC